MLKKGKLVTFEGCEGCGKSTQIELIKKYFKENNIEALFLREPGGSVISEKIRNIVLDKNNKEMSDKCELLLYLAARAQVVDEIIMPAINKGINVFCDRFSDSTIAYQGAGKDLGVDYVNELNKTICGEYIPNCTLFFDLTPEKAFLRKGGVDKNDRIELLGLNFHKKVYNGYKTIATKYKERITTVNAENSREDIFNEILNILKKKEIIE